METTDKRKLGKRKRIEGKDFEKRVYADLTEKGWIVNRWSNDVKENQIVQAKMKWMPTPRGRFPVNTTPGIPDFMCHKRINGSSLIHPYKIYDVIGVESKISGMLDKPEKEKCQWYLDNNVFNKILIASKNKIKNRIHIEYKEYATPREKSAAETKT